MVLNLRKIINRNIYKTTVCPGIVMVITPPHIQLHLSPLAITGPDGKRTLGFEEIHGDTMEGIQGAGVNVKTPKAAAVAEAVALATAGLDIVEHIPNVITFIIGIKSDIEATGSPEIKTLFLGMIFKEDGAQPHEQEQIAPHTAKHPT